MTLTAAPVDQNPIGYFRIFARPINGVRREITVFRGAPIQLGTASSSDPFTDTTASLDCPQITIFDAPGRGDLDWLVEDTDIDIVWHNYGSYDFTWSWEGYITSYDFDFNPNGSTFQIQLQGALFALDHYLAQPSYPQQPIPYEVLIRQAFDPTKYPARLSPLKITFPENWKKVVPEFDTPRYLKALKPTGVVAGQNWTGLTSRSTGSWEPMLSGHVQSLLTTMFDEGGSQWTVRNLGKRRPDV